MSDWRYTQCRTRENWPPQHDLKDKRTKFLLLDTADIVLDEAAHLVISANDAQPRWVLSHSAEYVSARSLHAWAYWPWGSGDSESVISWDSRDSESIIWEPMFVETQPDMPKIASLVLGSMDEADDEQDVYWYAGEESFFVIDERHARPLEPPRWSVAVTPLRWRYFKDVQP